MLTSFSRSDYFGIRREVLIISPQAWSDLKVSKHHYARTLADLGHSVWFLEPPQLGPEIALGEIKKHASGVHGITRVVYRPFFPYRIKFRARRLFNFAMQYQARAIIKFIGVPIDLVWDFDNAYQFSDLRSFHPKLSIFHPVDGVEGQVETKNADFVFSVSQSFLNLLNLNQTPSLLVPHGLSDVYENLAKSIITDPVRERQGQVTIGYVGNLDHIGIDWQTIHELAKANTGCRFRFFGPYSEQGRQAGLNLLESFTHVSFEGTKMPEEIASLAAEIDIWLVCYDPAKTTDGATNSHKVLEYLASGNPVLTNRILEYAERRDLVVMPQNQKNGQIPDLLARMLDTLDQFQSPACRRNRANFALQHGYSANLKGIDHFISRHIGPMF